MENQLHTLYPEHCVQQGGSYGERYGLDFPRLYRETGLVPLYFASVRCSDCLDATDKSCLVVYAYDLYFGKRKTILVYPIIYPVIVPSDTLDSFDSPSLAWVKSNVLTWPPKTGSFFNGETKRWIDGSALAFHSKTNYGRFCSQAPHALTYNRWMFFEGNAQALINGLFCSTVYLVNGNEPTNTLRPSDFTFDARLDENVIAGCLDSIIIPAIKREAAFDIETVVFENNLDPDLVCNRYEAQRNASLSAVLARKEKCCLDPQLLPKIGVENNIALSMKEITSISLVVRNYGGARKTMSVFYNSKRCQGPLAVGEDEDIAVDPERVDFIACGSEYEVLVRFTAALRDVDVLYVYNQDFDMYVIEKRIGFYSDRNQSLCCQTHKTEPKTRELPKHQWNSFMSKDPELWKPVSKYSHDVLLDDYSKMLDAVSQEALRLGPLPKGAPFYTESILRQPRNAGVWENKIRPLIRDFRKRSQKVQHTRFFGFNCDIIDLHKVTNQPHITRQAKKRKLDLVASVVIQSHRPTKDKRKVCKLKDIHKDNMDSSFLRGGTSLYRYLIYNLVDSLLLTRMAKALRPVQDYIYRLRATLNIDIMCHGRGNMYFNGFVQSTKAVEMPLLKSKLDGNITAYVPNDLHLCAVPIEHRQTYGKSAASFVGGYVSQPFRHLFYAGPAQSMEAALDFASLYPSNMIDVNVSPEAVVGSDPTFRKFAADYVVYDWSKVSSDLNVYTLVLKVNRSDPRNPVLVKHRTYTNNSLERYLRLRKEHKALLQVEKDKRDYHEKQQSEMKICANSHFGVAPLLCQRMITALGRKKIRAVNDYLKEFSFEDDTRACSFSNYGDTDSTMFYTSGSGADKAPLSQSSFDDPSAAHESMAAYIRNKVRYESKQVYGFLEFAKRKLFDAMMCDMLYVGSSGDTVPLDRVEGRVCETSGFPLWVFKDPQTGVELNATAAYVRSMITKLEFESAASIGLHLQKKMYILLTHEVDSDAYFITTKIKRQGVMAKKSTAKGATSAVSEDFENVILRGGCVVLNPLDVQALVVRSWDKIEKGQKILYMDRDPEFDADGVCLNYSEIRMAVHSVTSVRVCSERLGTLDERTTLLIDAAAEDGNKERRVIVHMSNGFCLNHFFSWENTVYRSLAYVHLSCFRAFHTAAGFLEWTSLVDYNYIKHTPPELLQKKRRIGVGADKGGKVSSVILSRRHMKNLTGLKQNRWPKFWEKQDPSVAFWDNQPFDPCVSVLYRDFYGAQKTLTEAAEVTLPSTVQNPFSKERRNFRYHHGVLKDYLDKTLVNPNAKYLTHVIIEALCFKTRFPSEGFRLGDMCEKMRRQLEATYRKINGFIEEGDAVFREMRRSVPVEFNPDRRSEESHTLLRFFKVVTKQTLDKVPRLKEAGFTLPDCFYDRRVIDFESFAAKWFLAAWDAVKKHPEVFGLVAEGSSAANGLHRLYTVPQEFSNLLPPDERGETVIVRVCSDTDNVDLIRAARDIYIAEVFMKLRSERRAPRRLNPVQQTVNRFWGPRDTGAICAPPKEATKDQLEDWLKGCLTLGPNSSAHCVACHDYWTSVDCQNYISTEYVPVDGECKVLRRKRKVVCVLEAALETTEKEKATKKSKTKHKHDGHEGNVSGGLEL
ncbi:UNVERIFIED_CONTAM: hypothetical protein FKN15_005916 [Acipenser sinensis]